MSKAHFQIVYDGPALENSTIDVKELSPALLALGQVIEEANLALNGSKTHISLQVKGSFKSGCFGIGFEALQSFMDQTMQLFKDLGVTDARDIVETLGFVAGGGWGLVNLLKWLKGKPITEIVLLDNGRVKIICDNNALETERNVIDLYRNYKLRRALESAICKPLEKEGMASVAFTNDNGEHFETITKAESRWFKAPEQEEELISDKIEEVKLQLVSVSFKEDNKWRFSDGGNAFYAAIMDDDFLNRVKTSEESFSAGDILTVALHVTQYLAGDNLRSEYEIHQVIDHRRTGVQLHIPLRDSDELSNDSGSAF